MSNKRSERKRQQSNRKGNSKKQKTVEEFYLESILQELKDNKLQSMYLDSTGKYIGSKGAIKVAEALKINTSLTLLDLGKQKIDDEGAIKLFEALKSNSSLIQLNLSYNEIGNEGALELSEALKSNTSLATLNLFKNQIGKEGGIKVAEALTSNTSLTSLDLCWNNVGDEGVIKLAEALKANTSLTEFYLGYTDIDLKVWQQIRNEIDQTKKMWRGIHDCIRTNDLEQLMTLLSKHTINLNSFNRSNADGDTILHSAAKSNDVKMIQFILKRLSPSIRRIMSKMYNTHGQLPADLVTRWTPSTHSLFPLKFRQVVKALLMLGAKRQDGTPYYPQTLFYKLPKDVLFLILQYASA